MIKRPPLRQISRSHTGHIDIKCSFKVITIKRIFKYVNERSINDLYNKNIGGSFV